MQIELIELRDRYSILKLNSLPDVRVFSGFFTLSRTGDEISLVCLTDEADKLSYCACEDGYAALRVAGKLDFSLVGVLSRLTSALAAAGIPVCAISTYDTDYLLIKQCSMQAAEQALSGANILWKGLEKSEEQ